MADKQVKGRIERLTVEGNTAFATVVDSYGRSVDSSGSYKQNSIPRIFQITALTPNDKVVLALTSGGDEVSFVIDDASEDFIRIGFNFKNHSLQP